MLRSIAAQDAALRAMYGDAHAASMPASFTVHFYTADPDDGGVELAQAGGYVPKTLANTSTNFPNPDVNALLETADIVWLSTGAWSDIATWAQLKNGGGVLYNGAPLPRAVDVTEAGVEIRLNARIFFNEFTGV